MLHQKRLIFTKIYRTKYSSKLLYHKIEFNQRKKKCKFIVSIEINFSRKYIKEGNIDIAHLNEINSVFLDCDEDRKGTITKKSFLL